MPGIDPERSRTPVTAVWHVHCNQMEQCETRGLRIPSGLLMSADYVGDDATFFDAAVRGEIARHVCTCPRDLCEPCDFRAEKLRSVRRRTTYKVQRTTYNAAGKPATTEGLSRARARRRRGWENTTLSANSTDSVGRTRTGRSAVNKIVFVIILLLFWSG